MAEPTLAEILAEGDDEAEFGIEFAVESPLARFGLKPLASLLQVIVFMIQEIIARGERAKNGVCVCGVCVVG